MGKTVGTWDKLKMHPMTLMRLVIDGRAKIVGKDEHGRYIYELSSCRQEGVEHAV